jgi:hypothetical protein
MINTAKDTARKGDFKSLAKHNQELKRETSLDSLSFTKPVVVKMFF